MPPLPAKRLLEDRRIIDDRGPSISLIQDLRWFKETKCWGLCVEVTLDFTPSNLFIKRHTQWWILIYSDYPFGQIKIYPDKKNGITHTFKHQSQNTDNAKSLNPWRNGDICYETPNARFNGYGEDDFNNRFGWVLTRLNEWCHRAATNTLTCDDEEFELPAFGSCSAPTVAFSESQESFEKWQDIKTNWGVAELLQLSKNEPLLVSSFNTLKGESLYNINWGHCANSIKQKTNAIWIRLSQTPVIEPYQAPITWGDLYLATKIDIDIEQALRESLSKIRDEDRPIALIGFPIANTYKSLPQIMHWQALSLPPLSSDINPPKGFRRKDNNYWAYDRLTQFATSVPIKWRRSANWNNSQLSARGELDNVFLDKRIALIGAGAVGSILAEILVRLGIANILIIDKDILSAGNLIRHTLNMHQIDKNKATAIASHLNSLHPHAKAEAINDFFPPAGDNMKKVRECDMLIDCTADDNVLREIQNGDWQPHRIVCSISLGFNSDRLYLVLGTTQDDFSLALETAFATERQLDKEAYMSADLPRDATGCWHPLFPARIDKIYSLVSFAIRYIEKLIKDNTSVLTATLFELTDEQITTQKKV